MSFRELPLPAGISGKVFLHSMLGRSTKFHDDAAEIAEKRIATVLRLTSDQETERKSPEYWDAIKCHTIGWQDLRFEISDYGIPRDLKAFMDLMDRVAYRLAMGENILVHCGAGIGRTGTVACAILAKLGVGLEEAIRIVGEAGSYAEDEQQLHFLKGYEKEVLQGEERNRV